MAEHLIFGRMPVLALRGIVIYPEQTVHFDIGRVKSALALEAAMKHDQMLFLVPQKEILDDDPDLNGLYPVGTVVKVKQILKSQGENIRVLVDGLHRAKLTELSQMNPYLAGTVETIAIPEVTDTMRLRVLRREANSLYASYLEFVERPAQAVQLRLMVSDDCGFMADTIAQNSGIEYPDKAKLLCLFNPARRLETVLKMLQKEIQMLQIESNIQERTRVLMEQEQKDYYLREQMKAIREELGEGDDHSEFAEYEKNILLLNLPEESEQKLLQVLFLLREQQERDQEAFRGMWEQELSCR